MIYGDTLLDRADIQDLVVTQIGTKEVCDGVTLPYYEKTGYPVTVAAPGDQIGTKYNKPFTAVGAIILAELLSDDKEYQLMSPEKINRLFSERQIVVEDIEGVSNRYSFLNRGLFEISATREGAGSEETQHISYCAQPLISGTSPIEFIGDGLEIDYDRGSVLDALKMLGVVDKDTSLNSPQSKDVFLNGPGTNKVLASCTDIDGNTHNIRLIPPNVFRDIYLLYEVL